VPDLRRQNRPLLLARALVAFVIALSGCGRESAPPTVSPPAPPTAASGNPVQPPSPPWFVDVTAELGLPNDFGVMPDGQYELPEIMGPGVALFDCDGDGDLDLLERRCPPPGHPHDPAPDRLWRREVDGPYVDVSAQSKLHDPGFGQGVAIGDVDNDGDNDVYCANLFHDAFYLNNGDGTFTDATESTSFAATDG